MNLKQAAAVLGVHYQTAYKWVRSGDLVAVRVGGRYEVSEAAIERFRARRAAIGTGPLPVEHPTRPAVEAEDVLEELEAMLADPFLGLQTLARFTARRLAETFGGACAFTIFDESGLPTFVKVDHPNPGYATLVSSLVESFGSMTLTPGFGVSAFGEQKLTRISHVPQDVFRSQLRRELHQHVGIYPIRSLLSVPIVVDGEARGVLTCTRSEAERPHSDEDEALLIQMAERIGRLVATADEVKVAVAVRHKLTAALEQLVELPHRQVAAEELERLCDSIAGRVDLPVAIMDPERVLVAVNPTFCYLRESVGNPIGSVFDAATDPVDREADRQSFD